MEIPELNNKGQVNKHIDARHGSKLRDVDERHKLEYECGEIVWLGV